MKKFDLVRVWHNDIPVVGECQICGRNYTMKSSGDITRHSAEWHNGVCPGSEMPVAQISCAFARDYAAQLIAEATAGVYMAWEARIEGRPYAPLYAASCSCWEHAVRVLNRID